MQRRILREGLIVMVETALLLFFAATWGIPGDDRPEAFTESAPAPAVSPLEDHGGHPSWLTGPP